MNKSDLPFGSEFSPSQINLPQLLEIVHDNEGTAKDMEVVIRDTFFQNKGGDNYNQNKLANNCRLGLKNYGIIDEQSNFTDLGRQLYDLKNDEKELYDTLSKHILLNLNGMFLVNCIEDIILSGEGTVTLDNLRPAMMDHGIYYPPGGKHPSIMRLWLSKSGIFPEKGWEVNSIQLKRLLGIGMEEYIQLMDFSPQQRAFIQTLANVNPTEPQPANSIVKLASTTYGVKFPEKSLPKSVLNDLEEAGYITTQKTTSGRGSKPFLVMPTDKLKKDLIEPLFKQLEDKPVSPKLLKLIRQPLSEILDNIKSSDRYISGLALEALAFKLMKYVDLDYIETRLRSEDTGGAEIDLLFESTRLVYSRWQIQCKNTAHVSLDDVAKEVGLTHFLKSNVIVIISTGKISREARNYSNKIMSDMNLCIVMIDGEDINNIIGDATYIVEVLNREALHAMKLKRLS